MPMHTSGRLNAMVESSQNWVLPAECGESVSSTNLLGKVLEAFNSDSTSGINARPADRDVFPLLNGATSISAPVQSPSFESMGIHSHKKIKESSILSKGELSSDAVHCHSLKPCDRKSEKAQLDKLEVHLSDTCQWQFVMFDQSGSKKRMIFHPSMVHEFSALLQFPLEITNFKEYTLLERTRSAGRLREILFSPLCLDDSAHIDAMLPPNWQSTLSPGREKDVFQGLYATVAEVSTQDRVTDGLSKENTEDLDALLWSDDEVSSEGHSPSNLTWSDANSLGANAGDPFTARVDKKRKACVEAETDSTATSSYSTLKVFGSEIHHLGSGSGYGKEGFAVFDLSSADEESSSGSTNSPRQNQARRFSHKRPAKKTRNDKIHATLQLLRSIIPGGESMDAALLLGEAAQYVRNLQVEVEKLEGILFR
ncbi:hypothetical protein GOP47_0027841 [Adiantum capillus-veneris]|nr:hypothetical protein GOP47_0027841 [Adiantum capillus-veneris]